MNDPGITILFEGNRRVFEPGETLTVDYRIDSLSLVEARAIEVSVLWYTTGKGDEDLAVHHFVRQTIENGALIDLRKPQRMRTTLPTSPLSYDGVIVRVRWCVRVRLFIARGRELVAEAPFQLGRVPPATAVVHV
ncbi:MAG: hypothetical protein JNL96_01030 [Planctomycetaceae bacterium]|nr:hypothetical protein [Planctomycetaceae bacterium]